MTRRFCDLCETEMVPEDDKPFVRQLSAGDTKVVVSLLVTNEHLHAVTDICNQCKIKIVNEGETYVAPQIATLQKHIETPIPEKRSFFREPIAFVPSQPRHQEPQHAVVTES